MVRLVLGISFLPLVVIPGLTLIMNEPASRCQGAGASVRRAANRVKWGGRNRDGEG